MIQRALILSNRDKEGAQLLAARVGKYLREKGIGIRSFYSGRSSVRAFPRADMAICIGGDGTALFACRALAHQGIPILTIHYGKFGFITEVSVDNWQTAVDSILAGNFETEDRILIDISVIGHNSVKEKARGLNDAVISVAGLSQLMNYTVYLNKQLVEEYRADGLIVATPTGSTAYSVAAGGPILHPTLRALVVNPICPFALAHRPLVIPEDQRVFIQPVYRENLKITLTVDGQERIALNTDDCIEIGVSQEVARIVRSEQYSFFDVIRRKLGWAGAPNA